MPAIKRAKGDKKMAMMIIRKSNGAMSSEWLTDCEGFAVEFKSLSHAEAQFSLMQKTDESIVSFIVE